MIIKNGFLTIWFILYFFENGACSDCTYIQGDYKYHGKTYPGYHGICKGVTSDFTLNPSPQNASLVRILYVEGNSTIRHLQPTSSLSSLVSLKYLTLRKIELESIAPGAFRGLNELEDLNVNINEIKEIPSGVFSDLKKLGKLFLSRNQITKISVGTFANLSKLEYLDLSKNRIRHIEDGAFADLASLDTLDLDNNNINVLQENLFRDLQSFRRLFASNNLLSDLQDVGFGKQFSVLTLSKNHLNQFNLNLSYLPHLDLLDLSNGNLKEFDFALLGPTDTIKLKNNQISILKNLESVNANTIDVQKNNLTEIKHVSPHISNLILSYNRIAKIEGISEVDNKLTSLELAYNQEAFVNCSGFRHLKILDFTGNGLSTIDPNDFSDCHNLQILRLSSNEIESFQPNTFKDLTSLQRLDLSDNSLKSIDGNDFDGLANLTILFLQNNQISSLDVEDLVKNLPKLKEVKLGRNSFVCEDLRTLKHSFSQHKITILDKRSLRSGNCN